MVERRSWMTWEGKGKRDSSIIPYIGAGSGNGRGSGGDSGSWLKESRSDLTTQSVGVFFYTRMVFLQFMELIHVPYFVRYYETWLYAETFKPKYLEASSSSAVSHKNMMRIRPHAYLPSHIWHISTSLSAKGGLVSGHIILSLSIQWSSNVKWHIQ